MVRSPVPLLRGPLPFALLSGVLAPCVLAVLAPPVRSQAPAPLGVSSPALPADLQSAARELGRLMQVNPAFTAPVSLAFRPFRSPGCAMPGSTASASTVPCLSSLELPPALAQTYFVAFIYSLRAQVDPASDPELASALSPDRTLLLNSTRVMPSAGVAAEATACLIARELAGLDLSQLEQRQEAFARINAQLVTRLRSATGNAVSTKGKQELGLFLINPLLMALSKATTPEAANPLSATLLRSGHWRLLQQQAPEVAAALLPLATVSEELALRTWRDLDLSFALALRDRDALLEQQRQQAQVQALSRLAGAGIDPRSCAALYEPPPTKAELAPALDIFLAKLPPRRAPSRPLSMRYLPEQRTVVVFPAASSAPAGKGR